MQDGNKQESDSKKPVWKTASLSEIKPQYIRSPFVNNLSRLHRHIISFDKPGENEEATAASFESPPALDKPTGLTAASLDILQEVYLSMQNRPDASGTEVGKQPVPHDRRLEMEVESQMNSEYDETVIFEPCEKGYGVEKELCINNRIYALEERISRLEHEIARLEEIVYKHTKNRGIIRLDGSITTSACGCSVCSVE